MATALNPSIVGEQLIVRYGQLAGSAIAVVRWLGVALVVLALAGANSMLCAANAQPPAPRAEPDISGWTLFID